MTPDEIAADRRARYWELRDAYGHAQADAICADAALLVRGVTRLSVPPEPQDRR